MLVLGLCSKEHGQTARAIDALVVGLRDTRIVAAAVGRAASPLLDGGLLKAKRLAGALKRANDPATRHHLRVLVEHALSGTPATAPRDIAALLELLVHLRADVVEPLPAPTRTYIEGWWAGAGRARTEAAVVVARYGAAITSPPTDTKT